MGGNLTLGLAGTNGCEGVRDDPRQQTSRRPERRDLVRIFPAPRTLNHTIGWHERETRRVREGRAQPVVPLDRHVRSLETYSRTVQVSDHLREGLVVAVVDPHQGSLRTPCLAREEGFDDRDVPKVGNETRVRAV